MTPLKIVKEEFRDKKLYEQALTHRSWVNEHKNVRETNERLEFLGDAILEFVVSDELYSRYPDKMEGYLTALRANIVNTVNLSNVARKLNLGPELFLSKGEEDTGGRDNPSLLADTIEAIIGAIYMDRGFESAKNFILSNIVMDIEKIAQEPLKDAKSQLQEKVQSDGNPTPKYKVINEAGPDHAKLFTVEVSVGNNVLSQGQGNSKSHAEQDAARKALKNL